MHIVLTGATGNVGRPLVNILADAGHAVTAVARGTSPLPTRDGVKPLVADLAAPAAVRPSLASADALFVLVTGELVAADRGSRRIEPLLTDASEAGVRRVVLLSSQLASTRPSSTSQASAVALEASVRSTGLDWTIVRPSGFMTNDLWWAPTIKERKAVFSPYADVALPVIAPVDIASVAATALLGGHAHQSYVLTGPEALSPRERVRLLAKALDTRLDLVELSRDEAKAQLTAQMPEAVAEGTLDVLGHPTIAEQTVSDTVNDVLARPATSYADWAADTRAAFG